MNRKQILLKQHRQKKRMIMIIATAIIITWLLLAVFFTKLIWFTPIILLAFWIYHETLLADHLFYSPKQDYLYHFPENTLTLTVQLQDNKLIIPEHTLCSEMDTIVVALRLEATSTGYFFDPKVIIHTKDFTDQQAFEREVNGLRYLNLSGLVEQLQQGNVSITTKHCAIKGELTLYAFNNPDYSQQRIMIIAPHADDAELSAFGVYSRNANSSIITLTQGEIEADYYQRLLGLSKMEAAKLKGRLRSWDSVAIPLWAGIPIFNSVQLGYYCMQLKSMHENPEQAFPSKESEAQDIRIARKFNVISLPTDNDGRSTWNNLKKDLAYLVDHFKPEIIIMPHPELDPHEDHIQAALLIDEVLKETQYQPSTQLLYANHLHDNDRWPMGPANNGIALPPVLEALPAYQIWSPVLSKQCQLDKAMALAMQHDLQPPLSIKKRLRRFVQSFITRRKHPKTGENEFFRKAVRRHELFWVKPL